MRGGRTVLDTTAARYVWEHPHYPQYYVPVTDLDPSVLADARVYGADAPPGLTGLAHLDWDTVDAWYEEDEQVFVHPRDPYTRVDALRSSRTITVELAGTVLAESTSPVLVFETGLPTRYYLPRPDVDFTHLRPSETVTACPYKGITSAYWSTAVDGGRHPDVAWSYDFPTRQLQPVAGLVAFYHERVDITVDGVRHG